MKFFAATAALVGLAAANNATQTGEVVWTTEVVTAYTTYCPAPTTVVMNNKTHVVTEATTLTITDCPCTISKPHTGTPAKPTGTGVVPTGNKPTGPSKPSGTNPPTVNGAAAVAPFGAAALAALAML